MAETELGAIAWDALVPELAQYNDGSHPVGSVVRYDTVTTCPTSGDLRDEGAHTVLRLARTAPLILTEISTTYPAEFRVRITGEEWVSDYSRRGRITAASFPNRPRPAKDGPRFRLLRSLGVDVDEEVLNRAAMPAENTAGTAQVELLFDNPPPAPFGYVSTTVTTVSLNVAIYTMGSTVLRWSP